MRVLIAYGDNFLVYRQTIARTIRTCRPQFEICVADDESLGSEIARLTPDLVICGRPEPAEEISAAAAWMELPSDPSRPTKTRIGTKRSRSLNPPFSELLRVVDETEKTLAGGWAPKDYTP